MRQSGILMHITSLPGPYGIGAMGQQARNFVDFLQKGGQRLWQILPLTPTGYGDSPYQSCSAFAGNHYLIDLDQLIREGLLTQEEVETVCWQEREDRVDFGRLYTHRLPLLRLAFRRFVPDEGYGVFCRENRDWLPDFALYMALKDAFEGKPWYQWNRELKHRDPHALEQAQIQYKEQLDFYCFVQYQFCRQWQALRSYAASAGVRIVGDVPIYVPLDSCEVWTQPELFWLDEERMPVCVAGCPPDGFSRDGQLWGNPLYRWDVHARDGYAWWLRRMGAAARRYDVIRLDHFRGFESYWAVPFGDPTACNGKWMKGPGMDFIHALRQNLPQVEMIAEDLGFLTQEVIQLRQDSGYPGMKLLQFAFDSREPSDYSPHQYTADTVCYTGTHDNMTTRQWYEAAEEKAAKYAAEYIHLSSDETFTWGMIRTAMASVSDTCIVPMQDYLNLGEEGRMNLPGTCTCRNWTWRAEKDHFRDDLAEKIFRVTQLYGRCEEKKQQICL